MLFFEAFGLIKVLDYKLSFDYCKVETEKLKEKLLRKITIQTKHIEDMAWWPHG